MEAAYLVGQGRQAELHALAAIALALPVQRLMLAILLEQDHGQQARTRPTPRGHMERCGGLQDLLAVPAGELLAYRLDHLPAARDHLQRLGDVLAQLGKPIRAATATDLRRRNHHALARQMLRERLARWPPASERLDCRGLRGCLFGGELVLARARLQLLELQLQLVEQARLALRALAVDLAPQLLDHQFQGGDDRLGVRGLGHRLLGPRLGDRKGGAQGLDIGRCGADHSAERIIPAGFESRSFLRGSVALPRSTRALGPPAAHRTPPVDPFEQITELGRRNRDHAIGW